MRARVPLIALLMLSAFARGSAAQSAPVRIRESIDDGWKFLPRGEELAWARNFDDQAWLSVRLPHTWNASDPFDDAPGYRRGIGWYRRTLKLDSALAGKRVFLYFEGANQRADVYVNGAFAGEHKGGYTAFAFDVTSLLRFNGDETDNVVAVMVDNSHDPFVPPLSIGYALYGGLYRDVWLIATDPVHIDVTDHAAPGVFVTTPSVSRETATITVRGRLANDSRSSRRVRVVNTVTDSSGSRITQGAVSVTVRPNVRSTFALTLPVVHHPRLWSPAEPYLYTVTTDIYDGEQLLDRVTNPLGLRWYRFTADSGFFLNGQRLALHGTNRHQDYAGLGSALPDSLHVRDMELIKAMGANFVRLAHYPQDPAVLDAADRLGLLIWEEVPVVNYINPDSSFTANAEGMLRDMIRQHRNHPAVILWGIMNEALLYGGQGARVATHSDSTYVHSVRALAKAMNAVAHAEDPSRRTVMAIHESDDYDKWRIAGVVDVLGVNLYKGWYSGAFPDFGSILDARHLAHPSQPLLVSEYGAGSDERLNSLSPERFDFTGNWQREFHESHLRQIAARPWLAGTAIWNEFDFSQPRKGYSIPNRNQKGMMTWDRRAKDVYYLYAANWSRAPVIRVASHDWTSRIGTDSTAPIGAGPRPVTQPVTVYSNLQPVELFVNGRSLGAKVPDDVHAARWNVPFAPGQNVLEARGRRGAVAYADSATVDMHYYPPRLADASVPYRELGVNVGTAAQFTDSTQSAWAGDQPYRAGAFGYEGGTTGRTGAIVTGTNQVPLFITFREGLTAYRFDVPDGDYEVELLFAEPVERMAGRRVFTVSVNGVAVAERLDLAERAGRGSAVQLVTAARASDGEGIRVSFTAIVGKPLLSAIRVRRR